MKTATIPKIVNAPWPIIPIGQPVITYSDNERLRKIAGQLTARSPSIKSEWFQRGNVTSGWAPGLNIYIEDHRSIALSTEEGAKSFEYRSLALAEDGDYYLVSAPRNHQFESYMRDHAGLGAPTILELPKNPSAPLSRLAHACLNNEGVLTALSEAGKHHENINIIPFISSGDIWILGRELAQRVQRHVSIVGASPKLTALANNKLWFAQFVSDILGRDAVPVTFAAYGLAHAAAKICALARQGGKVVVKVPSSAGSMGNIVFDAAVFKEASLHIIHSQLADRLSATGWRRQFPILIGTWDQEVISSPSVQIWVPSIKEGAPIIEGVFTQIVSGAARGFIGAEPASLSGAVSESLKLEALKLARALQFLGYFGRLSLDAVLIGVESSKVEIHWIEANARWGGVSIPMTVAHKIDPGCEAEGLLIVQKYTPGMHCPDIEALQSQTGAPFVDVSNDRKTGILFLLPTQSNHLSFSVIGLPQNAAYATADEITDLCRSAAEDAALE